MNGVGTAYGVGVGVGVGTVGPRLGLGILPTLWGQVLTFIIRRVSDRPFEAFAMHLRAGNG